MAALDATAIDKNQAGTPQKWSIRMTHLVGDIDCQVVQSLLEVSSVLFFQGAIFWLIYSFNIST